MRVAALLLLAAAGCASTPPAVGLPGAELSDPKAEDAYQRALERVTEHREVYSALDTLLYAAATFQSPDFREARIRRQGAFQTWPPEKVEQTIASERAEAAQVHEVVFGVSIVEWKFNDFDSKKSIWRLSLVTDQGEVTPLRILRVGRANQDIRAYYPYMGDFWTMYTVTFPTTVEGRPLVAATTKALLFRMSSTQGQIEMRFPVTLSPAAGVAAPPMPTVPPSPPSPPSPASSTSPPPTR